MRKVILLIITLFSVTLMYAQTDPLYDKYVEKPLPNEYFFTQSELVIEGQFLRLIHTYNLKGTDKYEDGFEIIAIKVIRVYKGDQSLTGDTVYVAKKGGLLGQEKSFDHEITVSSYTPYLFAVNGVNQGINIFTPAIYFLVTSDLPDDLNSKFSTRPKYKEVKRYSKGEVIPFNVMFVFGNEILGLDYLVFHHREEFYNYMKQFKGFTVPEPAPLENLIEKNEQNEAVLDSIQQQILIEKKRLFMESLWNEGKIIREKEVEQKSQKKKQKNRTNNTVTFQMANHQLIYDNVTQKHYATFDVMVSSNNSNIYFTQTTLFLRYNALVCGNGAVENGKVTFTLGEDFTNSNCYHKYHNGYDNLMWLIVCLKDPPVVLNRVKLSSVPKKLGNVKIELLPHLNSGFSYFFFYDSNNSAYALTSNAPHSSIYFFDEVFLINSDTIPVSTVPKITNLSPTSRIAGVGDILTIDGSSFGSQRGTIYFKAADDGGQTYLKGLDNQYIDSWSNTQIRVKVPSLVYQGYSGGSSSGGAGSGTIKMKTAQSDSCESANSLYIPYSVMNGRALPTIKNVHRVHLTRYECNPDFEFTLHSEYNNPAHADKVRLIDTALSHWSALTGLVLRLEKNNGNYVYTNATNVAGKNIIQFTDRYDAYVDNAMGRYPYSNDTLLFRNTGSNVYFPRQPLEFSWNYNVTGYIFGMERSFYQTLMHELGHILQLGHVNDDSELMYYRQLGGHYIVNLTTTSTSVLAVKQNIAASKLQNWRSGTSGRYPAGALNATFTTIKAFYGVNNGSITTTVTGGTSSYTYKWTLNGVVVSNKKDPNNLAPGTYNLELKDRQICTQNYLVTVPLKSGFNPLALNFTITNTNPPMYKANVSGGALPYTYKWSAGLRDESQPIDPSGDVIKGSPPDKFRILEDNTLAATSYIVIYPNPTLGNFTISNINNATIYLYDVLSVHLKTFEHISNNEIINVTNLPAGIYLLKIVENNIITNKKLIITN